MTAALGPRVASFALAIVEALGTLVMWIGIPASWLWVASQIGGGSNLFSYLSALLVIPVSMLLFALVLQRLEAHRTRLVGSRSARTHQAWLKAMSGGDPPRTRGLLDLFMVVSAIVAVIAFLLWYILWSGPPPNVGVG
jgi:hypothetical protein